jgi:putative inorganic carbon (HCO3(-)) transporter
MRDLLVVLIVCGSLPFILMRPWYGVLVLAWLGYMNPHRLAWGFAYNFPFTEVVALVTLVGIVFSSERKRLPWSGTLFIWFVLIVWMNVTTLFALDPVSADIEWDRTMKIQLIAMVTLLLMHGRQRINALAVVIALSLGFFGVKGGIFTILTGGSEHVYGPPGSFIEDNNALGLALVMTMPLIWYLQLRLPKPIYRWAILGAIALTAFAILSTQSRGAFLAIVAMSVFLWFKSPKKFWTGLLIVVALPALFAFMPSAWHERMSTIETYQEDGSAMGRINAWWFAYNLAKDRPLVGGGFDTFSPELFQRYAPDPDNFHDAHSIYFEMLGEHGFVGLVLFLALAIAAFVSAQGVIRRARAGPQFDWARDLAGMVQTSLIGYFVGGAFLGLAYFDLYYHLVAIVLLLRSYIDDELAAAAQIEAPLHTLRAPGVAAPLPPPR